MSALLNVTKVGSAVERFGRVLVPGSQRRPRPENDDRDQGFRSDYLFGGSETFGFPRTIEEAQIANGRAVEAQREAPLIGRAVGGVVALGVGLWLGSRGGRR